MGYEMASKVDESLLLQNCRKAQTRPGVIIPLLAITVCVGVVIVGMWQTKTNTLEENADGFQWIEAVCRRTLYPEVCISGLRPSAGSSKADPKPLGQMAVSIAMKEATKILGLASKLARGLELKGPTPQLLAAQDCIELLDDTMDKLNASFAALIPFDFASSKQQQEDVQTWLSASLTNLDTCLDGLNQKSSDANANALLPLKSGVQNLTAFVSNSLAIVKTLAALVLEPNPLSQNLLLSADPRKDSKPARHGFPSWLSAADRRLLEASPNDVQPDVVVAQDGTGDYRTIAEAVNAAPDRSERRFVIKVKEGIYEEYIDVDKKKTNLMFVGGGMDATIVTGNRSVVDGSTTFRSATFAAVGKGFMARDMAFENTAGAVKHQAVALRVGSDQSVVYRCRIAGFQDTLYAHSLRQFYRDCEISGTVDFIFGNAAVVFQRCTVLGRKPMKNQKNTITAQGRTDPNENTGISIHACNITAAEDLIPVEDSIQTYLGRPWKQYSRTVVMQSYLGDLIHPAGWLEWDGDFALSTLYYGEYMNSGPGAGTDERVKWPGYHVITDPEEAMKFTVGELIQGNSWLDSTGVDYIDGLIA